LFLRDNPPLAFLYNHGMTCVPCLYEHFYVSRSVWTYDMFTYTLDIFPPLNHLDYIVITFDFNYVIKQAILHYFNRATVANLSDFFPIFAPNSMWDFVQ